MKKDDPTKAPPPAPEHPTPPQADVPHPDHPVGPTVDELAVETGHVVELVNPRAVTVPDAVHSAAACLHGWLDHAYHAGQPMRLHKADYLAALEAAKAPPKGQSALRPHPPALSPYCPHHFDDME